MKTYKETHTEVKLNEEIVHKIKLLGLEDYSYVNDELPSFGKEFSDGEYLQIHVDSDDISMKEYYGDDCTQFSVQMYDDGGEPHRLIDTDDFNEALRVIQEFKTKKQKS